MGSAFVADSDDAAARAELDALLATPGLQRHADALAAAGFGLATAAVATEGDLVQAGLKPLHARLVLAAARG